MKLVENILSDHLVQAIGWTILHSLWQGSLIAVLLAVGLIILRKNSSNIRYFVSVTALATVFLISIFTFYSYYSHSPQPQAKTDDWALAIKVGQVLLNQESSEQPATWESYFAFFGDYFEDHLPLIVTFWLLGIMILMLRFLGGIAYLQRLKHYKTHEVSQFWQGTTNYIARQIKLNKSVKLLESAVVKVPMVIGWLKPVILLPIGTLNGLTPRQVEIILAHELAHVYRHDYVVNIIQSLVEIALFFNPFVWWISTSIREERENCCDDLAVKATGEDQLAFAQTLVSLEEMRWQPTGLVPAFLGDKGSLLNRIKRLVQQNTPNSTFSEGFISALLLVFCLTIASFNTPQPNSLASLAGKGSWLLEPGRSIWNGFMESIKKNEDKPILAPPLEAEESVKSKVLKDDTVRFGNGFMIVTDRHGNVKMFKSGAEIPKEDFEKYKDVFSYMPGKKGTTASSNFSIHYSKDGEVFNLNIPIPTEIDLGDIDVPEIPELPNIPLPPVSLGMMEDNDTGNYVYVDDDGNTTKIYFRNGEVEKIIYNEKRLSKDSDEYLQRLRDLKRNEEKTRREFEREREKYNRELERYREDLERKREKISRKKYEEALRKVEESERRAEESVRRVEESVRRENERLKQKGQDKLFNEMRKDGLLNERRNKITARNGNITINGNTLSGSQLQKYKELFKKYLEMDVDAKGNSYSWTWEDEDN